MNDKRKNCEIQRTQLLEEEEFNEEYQYKECVYRLGIL